MKPIVLMTDSKLYKDERVVIIHLPFIGVEPLPVQPTRQHYDWLIFTSKNAVEIFFKLYAHVTFENIAAIGIKTKEHIEHYNHKVAFMPSQFNQESFIDEMGNLFNHSTVCLPISTEARPKMFDALKSLADVDRIDLYRPVKNDKNINLALQLIKTGKVDWITFMSPSSVKAFGKQKLEQYISVMAIGHVTSSALNQLNIEHYVSQKETKKSMIDTILNIENNRKGGL
nr:uroporphyrinogen-III synthase [Macrococcus goetzii]